MTDTGKTLLSSGCGAVKVVHGRDQEKGNMARSAEDVGVGRVNLNSFNRGSGEKLVNSSLKCDASTNQCKIRDKAQGPRSSSHNPLDGLSGQPSN